jgi:hypothetical protein
MVVLTDLVNKACSEKEFIRGQRKMRRNGSEVKSKMRRYEEQITQTNSKAPGDASLTIGERTKRQKAAHSIEDRCFNGLERSGERCGSENVSGEGGKEGEPT